MDRRTFIAASASTLTVPAIGFGHGTDKLRVGVIGHTGRGDYGHGLDTVWLRIPETEIVCVADANSAGLAGAAKKLQVDNSFTNYRKMLTEVTPSIVAVCPRQPDQHRDMILAAIDSGARGIYVEKPFCRTPAEADEIIAACDKRDAKLAVAHRNRYHPTLQAIDKLIADGGIGKVLEIRGRGKGDRRGGAEDLWVLGSHVLNLMNYFGGTPKSCSAVLLQDGRRVTKADVHEGNEALGLLAGNEVHARYEMERGFIAYFDSVASDGTRSAGFGLQIIGSEGIVDINCDKFPLAYLVRGNPFEPTAEPRPWIPITSAGADKPEPIEDIGDLISHHVSPARDLIAAIRDDRQPLCNVREGATTVEMICAAFASHRESSKAVAIPLEHRGNELARL
ncbi:Gfo/Idh/MocA family protein [Rubripirellula reticaptiva]|uniref:Putative oxidoreductase n=1 Tax=Rubripirellula reticaptiva TaxID=2528013 RepID=A0A5C6EIE2_9BACT|nr:Gfo/Idh/MocA family oxidoreductase [Rubripirellula reticaptiva]TWU47029.1 putative oxidoreductase [Rubripirellula reticaptiva]